MIIPIRPASPASFAAKERNAWSGLRRGRAVPRSPLARLGDAPAADKGPRRVAHDCLERLGKERVGKGLGQGIGFKEGLADQMVELEILDIANGFLI